MMSNTYLLRRLTLSAALSLVSVIAFGQQQSGTITGVSSGTTKVTIVGTSGTVTETLDSGQSLLLNISRNGEKSNPVVTGMVSGATVQRGTSFTIKTGSTNGDTHGVSVGTTEKQDAPAEGTSTIVGTTELASQPTIQSSGTISGVSTLVTPNSSQNASGTTITISGTLVGTQSGESGGTISGTTRLNQVRRTNQNSSGYSVGTITTFQPGNTVLSTGTITGVTPLASQSSAKTSKFTTTGTITSIIAGTSTGKSAPGSVTIQNADGSTSGTSFIVGTVTSKPSTHPSYIHSDVSHGAIFSGTIIGTAISPKPTSTGTVTASLGTNRMVIHDDDDHVFTGTMTNTSTDTTVISFMRSQILPRGWTSSVCFGTNCYASFVDTMAEAFAPGESRDLIVHVTAPLADVADSGYIHLRLRAENGNPSDTVSFDLRPVFVPGNPPLVFGLTKSNDSAVFHGNGPFVLSASFENRAVQTLLFNYHLDAQLPQGWTTGLCIRDSCGSTDITYPMAPQVAQAVRLQLQSNGTVLTSPDSAVFYLTVRPQTSNSADSALYRFVAYLQPSASVEASELTSNGLQLNSIFPNPNSGSFEIAFTNDRAEKCDLQLYNSDGHLVLTKHLGAAASGITKDAMQIDGLPSGAYFARVSDGNRISNPILVRIKR